jgi:hypothetical protein
VRNYSLMTLSRPLVGLVSTVLIVLALSACRKELGPPSPEYEEARQRFSKIYGQKLDEAFIDPEMDAIEALLQQVPVDSMDAQSAKELQQRIKDGRAKMEKALQEREAAIAAARQGVFVPSTPTSTPTPAPTPAPQESKDAGPSTQGPVMGSPASELVAGYLGCFKRSSPITVKDRGQREAWELSTDRARCSQSFPTFVGQVVLIEEGKVLTVLPKSAVQVTYQAADAGPAPGGTPPAPGGTPPAPGGTPPAP